VRQTARVFVARGARIQPAAVPAGFSFYVIPIQ
jgi:hypothetical protein